MSALLVTGANGFVGQALCTELLNRGHSVRAVVRTNAAIERNDCEVIKLHDIASDPKWMQSLHGVDAVIHLAARVHVMHENAINPLNEFRKINVFGTEHLARAAAAAGVKRFVFVSSVKVNGEATKGNDRFSESDTPSPQDAYGISKWEAEQALHRVAMETGLEVVIVRPPLVYGRGVKGNFSQMLSALRKRIPLPLACVKNSRSLIYLGNLVDALILCATHVAAAGQTYLVSDGEDVSTPVLLSEIGIAMMCPVNLLPCPVLLIQLGASLLGKAEQMQRLTGSLRVDSGKIFSDLNWRAPFSLQQGLRATVQLH
jgi:nucleoside-diphosphate-sugar epimerase